MRRKHRGRVVLKNGERIGVWYSSMIAGITTDPDTRVVFIATDTPWLRGGGSDGGGRP